MPVVSDLFFKGLEDLVSHVQLPEFFNLLCKRRELVKRLETTANAHLKWRKQIGVDDQVNHEGCVPANVEESGAWRSATADERKGRQNRIPAFDRWRQLLQRGNCRPVLES